MLSFILIASILTNASHIAALTDSEYTQQRHCRLIGRVTSVIPPTDFVISVDNERLFFRDYGYQPPPDGATVLVDGQTHIDLDHQRLIRVNSCSVLKAGEPSAPEDISALELRRGEADFKKVRLTGTVVDIAHDEIDYRYDQLVLRTSSHTFHAAVQERASEDELDKLIGAEVRLTGTVLPGLAGSRHFIAQVVVMNDYASVEIVNPHSPDPFDAPLLENRRRIQHDQLASMGRRRVCGTTIARRGDNQFIVETPDHMILRVTTARNRLSPPVGSTVEVVGFPETDFFHVNLSRAVFRDCPGLSPIVKTVSEMSASKIFLREGRSCINPKCHGKLLRLSGIVRSMSGSGHPHDLLSVECDGFQVSVDCSGVSGVIDDIQIGYQLRVTGVCILEIANWSADVEWPRLTGITLVPRFGSDIEVVARLPWWTPARLLMVICSLLAILVAVALWNWALRHLVERRSRALMREEIAHAQSALKVEERTRLDVELHDTLSQDLTGVALQLDAAQMAAESNSGLLSSLLEQAVRKMQSCRKNLRDCLWDLRSRALEEAWLSDAIRKTLLPLLGEVRLDIDCRISCQDISDNTIHAILSILRELSSNAIHHGKATHIRISASLLDESIALSVSDNGSGFDPETRPGIPDGHFGLQGVSERVHRLGGKFSIQSQIGVGTTVEISEINANA